MIFVFGSNEKGIHGKGSARTARMEHGAIPGQGFGPQGSSFAIPTCAKPTESPDHKIGFDKLEFYVRAFLLYTYMHPELDFQVTQIGCGLAGWTPEQVAPLFRQAEGNCWFDTAWKQFLGDRKYWGHR
jgi:hypothetical protein